MDGRGSPNLTVPGGAGLSAVADHALTTFSSSCECAPEMSSTFLEKMSLLSGEGKSPRPSPQWASEGQQDARPASPQEHEPYETVQETAPTFYQLSPHLEGFPGTLSTGERHLLSILPYPDSPKTLSQLQLAGGKCHTQ